MKSLNEIKLILNTNKEHLLKKYPIEELAIFGSYSREEQTNVSDVDILVSFNANVGIEFIDLAEELEQLLGTKVDLVSKHGLKKRYLDSLINDVVYVKEK